MNNYEKLLNEINEYLNKKEINNEGTSTEIISLYDLLKTVSNELKEFRNILTNSTLSKKLKLASKFSPFVDECSITVDTFSYQKDPCINFRQKHNYYTPFGIYKVKNVNDIYFNTRLDHRQEKFFKKFVKKNYDIILENFQLVEKYIELLGSISNFSSTFTDDLFEIKISLYYDGDVRFSLTINSKHPLYEEYSKQWYQRENICDYVERHKAEILKRFSVVPRNLEEPFNRIYEKAKKEVLEPEKVKTIGKISR